MKKWIINSALLLLLVSGATSLTARHIIGGEFVYKCRGAGQYDFELKVYRDCASSGADFDNPAIISIYKGSGLSYSLVRTFESPLYTSFEIPIEEMPCMEIPSNICVQEGQYKFSIDLPVSSQSYHIVYQRCCRNNSITNIYDPGGTGATYTIELTPAAQSSCNNSPTFSDYPPILICANNSIDFDHSAVDVDGDQLVYEFCSPLRGGGLAGSPEMPGDPSSCIGVAPNPACPPPFYGVDFVLPEYSPSQPMAGNPVVKINSSTGFITGVPELLGQYVVGVCVSEYRNGVLLSVVRRDFQFNVTDCQPLVQPAIENSILTVDTFVVKSCGDNTVTLLNTSTQRQNIFTFYWEFDVLGNGVNQTFSDWSPQVTFPNGTGEYPGKLYLNPNEQCGDTANVLVQIYPALQADFSLTYDTCVAGPVDFTDHSFTNADSLINWSWAFGEGGASTQQNPSYDYLVPGNHEVTLIIEDNNECLDTFAQVINYYPVPALLVVDPSQVVGCAPQLVAINNLSYPIDESYDILWDLGDGQTSTAVSPEHLYETAGLFDVSVNIVSPLGCQTSAAWSNLIRVRESPIAGFSYTPESVNNYDSEVTFTDESQFSSFWYWEFGTDGISYLQNPVYSFRDTGVQVVMQVVEHPDGCVDTLIKFLDVIPEYRYFLPNAFSPNGDGLNDLFLGAGLFENISNFQMQILNRWGELVFETTDPGEGWNGRKRNNGQQSPGGVYVYQVQLTGPRGEASRLKGFVTLIR